MWSHSFSIFWRKNLRFIGRLKVFPCFLISRLLNSYICCFKINWKFFVCFHDFIARRTSTATGCRWASFCIISTIRLWRFDFSIPFLSWSLSSWLGFSWRHSCRSRVPCESWIPSTAPGSWWPTSPRLNLVQLARGRSFGCSLTCDCFSTASERGSPSTELEFWWQRRLRTETSWDSRDEWRWCA